MSGYVVALAGSLAKNNGPVPSCALAHMTNSVFWLSLTHLWN